MKAFSHKKMRNMTPCYHMVNQTVGLNQSPKISQSSNVLQMYHLCWSKDVQKKLTEWSTHSVHILINMNDAYTCRMIVVTRTLIYMKKWHSQRLEWPYIYIYHRILVYTVQYIPLPKRLPYLQDHNPLSFMPHKTLAVLNQSPLMSILYCITLEIRFLWII